MREVLLTALCRPKQWKTISTRDLKSKGYPVYGANGKIGFYDIYTHENPTLLITCRGATCGTINYF
jgi:type I restriction enzyme S subunit